MRILEKIQQLTVIVLLAALLTADVEADDGRAVNVGFFEAGTCLGHEALRTEYLRQLRLILPDSVRAVTIPSGYRSAEWKRDKCRLAARELAANPEIDLLVAMGPWVVEDLLEAGFDRPIVAMYRVDPVREGLLDSKGRPVAPNLTVHVRPGKIESDLHTLAQLTNVRRLGVLYFASGEERPAVLEELQRIGWELGIEIVSAESYNKFGTFAFFKAYGELGRRIDALYVFPMWDMEPVKVREFFAMTSRDRVPVFTWEGRHLVERGAFASDGGFSVVAEARYNAWKTARIIQGELPADLPTVFDCPRGITVGEEAARICGVQLQDDLRDEVGVVPSDEQEQAEWYTLPEAARRALDTHPTHSARREAVSAAMQDAKRAYSEWLPHLSASYAATRIDENSVANSEGVLDRNQTSLDLNLSQTVFSLETLETIRAGERGVELARVDHIQSGIDLELAVCVAYGQYLRSLEALSVLSRHRDRLNRWRELAAARDAFEDGPIVDKIRLDMELDRATIQVVAARRDIDVARVRLNSLLNLPGETALALDSSAFSGNSFVRDYEHLAPVLSDRQTRDQIGDYLVGEGLRGNPSMSAYDVRITLQEKLLDRNRARYFPTVNLEARWRYADELADRPPEFYEEKSTWSVGGILNLPLFEGTDRIRERGRMRARLRELEYLRDQVSLEVMHRVRSGLHTLVADAANIRRMARVEGLATQNLDLAVPDYESGRISHLDLLDALQTDLDAKLATIEARYSYHAEAAALAHEIGWSVLESDRIPSAILIEKIGARLK